MEELPKIEVLITHKRKNEWAKRGGLTRLQSQVKRDKTLEVVMDKVQIKEEMVDRKENINDN